MGNEVSLGSTLAKDARRVSEVLGGKVSVKTVQRVLKVYLEKSFRGTTNPKGKGSSFERQICLDLDHWWAVPEKTFVRSRLSGGWKDKQGKIREPGDIVSRFPELTKDFPFVVECKSAEAWDFHDLFRGDTKHPIRKWWIKIFKEAVDSNKVPLLVVRRSHKPLLAITVLGHWPVFLRVLDFNGFGSSVVFRLHLLGVGNLVCLPWEDFMKIDKSVAAQFEL
jgi:hypothetical protein